MSELGSYLHEGKSAPAATKRLGNLLRAVGWDKKLIERYLWMKADERIEELEKSGEEALNVWDESVIEKTESERTEGLCAVKSSKAVRLKKTKKRGVEPTNRETDHGLRNGMDWDVTSWDAWSAGSGNDALVDKKRERSKYPTRTRDKTCLGSSGKMGKKSDTYL